MGLFGGSKTYVTSVVYNLAGDIDNRPNYLKSLIVRDNIYETGDKAKSLKDGYVYGPGIKLRSFGRWSQGDYADVMGTSYGSLPGANSLDVAELTDQIALIIGDDQLTVQKAELDFANPDWWADQWMLANHPDLIDTDYQSDFDEGTGEMVILLADNTTTYRFAPVNYDPASRYIYAVFNTYELVHHPAVPGDDTVDPPIAETPAYDEWVYGDVQIFLYKIGTGNTVLDNMVAPDSDGAWFFPIIPLRIDNKFVGPDKDQWDISDLGEDATDEQIDDAFKAKQEAHPEDELPINFPDIYPMAKKAMKKSIGAKFGKVIDGLAKNVSLKDIDYAYAVFGACINTKEETAKLYLWRFFDRLADTQGDYDPALWDLQLQIYKDKMAIWKAWLDAGGTGTEPEKPTFPALLTQWIRIYAEGSAHINYDIIINWNGMARSSGTGMRSPTEKVGSVWWEVGADLEYEEILYSGETETTVPRSREQVTIFTQVDEDNWDSITIWDLVHRNMIYNGKAVEITAKQAILSLDDDGNTVAYEESGFIVPLNYDLFREMPLVKSTQMATATCYLVLNCYKVVKKKWYQTFIFQVFLIVVIIAISFVFPPFGATSGGILGSNAAVGMAIGLTGAAAIVIGGIINAIAAMVVAKLVGMVSVEVFGDKWGAIIGAIATFAALSVGSNLANGGSLSASFSKLTDVPNILSMTNAVGQGIQGYVGATVKEMQNKLTELQNETADKQQGIDDLYAANIGSDRAYLDPMGMISHPQYVAESSDLFLSRTLMTGSDIADFTLSLLTNFAEWTITTELP